jgi:hypothetical protein
MVAELPALHDGCAKGGRCVRWIAGYENIDGQGSCAFAKDGDFAGVAAEGCDVTLDPFEGETLI